MRACFVLFALVAGCSCSSAPDADAGADGGHDASAIDASTNDGGSDAGLDACAICGQACGTGLPSCDDGELCNGTETCHGAFCAPGTPAPDGTVCRTTGKGAVCFSGVCVPNP